MNIIFKHISITLEKKIDAVNGENRGFLQSFYESLEKQNYCKKCLGKYALNILRIFLPSTLKTREFWR